MPVRDHFQPPLQGAVDFHEIHALWIANLTRNLNRTWLPPSYRATPERYFGSEFRVDVGVLREPEASYTAGVHAESAGEQYRVPPPDATTDALRTPQTRVVVRNPDGRLVAAVEFVSPANKDRPEARDAFAGKIENYLQAGIALVVVDIVTARRHNLHERWTELFGPPGAPRFEEQDRPLYAVAYRPYTERAGKRSAARVDFWLRPLRAGDELPVLPLFIEPDLAVPVELEATYEETLTDLRLEVAAASEELPA